MVTTAWYSTILKYIFWYLYFILVFSFYVNLYFYSSTFWKPILYFLLH